MICWVVERALAARNITRVIVATDDQRIVAAVRASGFDAIMTRRDHVNGTDRIAEIAATLEDAEIVVNLQGDEPLISPETIERAVAALVAEKDFAESHTNAKQPERETSGAGDWGMRRRGDAGTPRHSEREPVQSRPRPYEGVGMVTTWETMESAAEVLNPDVVKIVLDESGRALYFSRAPVPHLRDAVRKYGTIEAALRNEPALLREFRKHTGLYVYRRDVLLGFTKWRQSRLEENESLEQLRALEHGVKIKAIEASTRSIGVDTQEDLERVREIMENESFEFRV